MNEDRICSHIRSAAFLISSVICLCHGHDVWGGFLMLLSIMEGLGGGSSKGDL